MFITLIFKHEILAHVLNGNIILQKMSSAVPNDLITFQERG